MRNRGIIGISGVTDSRTALVMSRIIQERADRTLIITASEARAVRLADDLSFFLHKDVVAMPEEDRLFLSFDARDQDRLMARLRGLNALTEQADCVVVAPASAAVKKVMPHRQFSGENVTLTYGEEADPEQVKEKLTALGYERMAMVESRGEFSLRGGILDVFPPEGDRPYRIEFFDTEVDSIRTFDIDTQRSLEKMKTVKITPAQQVLADKEVFRRAEESVRRAYSQQAARLEKQGPEWREAAENLKKRRDTLCEYIADVSNIQLLESYLQYFYPAYEYLWDYLEDGCLMIDDPDRTMEALSAREKEQKEDFAVLLERGQAVPKDGSLISGPQDLRKAYAHQPLWLFTPFPKPVKGVDTYQETRDYRSRPMTLFGGKMDLFASELKRYLDRGYRVTIAGSSSERIRNIQEFLEDQKIDGRAAFVKGRLSQGMDFPEEKVCYITDGDIFGTQARRKRRKKPTGGQALENFTDLKKGDYVVHENHGIGKFLGIEQLKIQGEQKDYLKIKYAGSDLLYVPAEQFDIVQKYIGAEGAVPRLNKLSGEEWKQTKARARAAIAEMTDELIDLYARREMKKGYAFSPDTPWQREFEEEFPYEETEDQLRCVREIKKDMEAPRAMDRLLCGDVGFGKTEVAARAIFKCLTEGKQAALLVPTTLLANQHYFTLKDRFSKFPLKVEMLSRFRSEQEQKQILAQLAAGDIDLIIGTHRLLSKDVKYKDLGLLVVDEEQRFGVAHKEKIKQLKENVDVLTLSATPIPRTLNMSLTGIKDMSVIEEPPEERYPVQTYVMEQNDAMIQEAVLREMDRGGQVFVVYNRVNGIAKIAAHIQELVPEARVCVGHGRMSEQKLEDMMLSFVDGQYDVLVATTIIESGIDIPNANTLIVLDADRFGLAQLYQLRGRVGRSNRMAYAYLMYQRDKVLTEVAEKRLRAIREFTEFGSGFKVAMRDLQIRGAGNLLGSEQSGHMMNIGYELYCKLVNDAVKRLQGEQVTDAPEEAQVELAVSANIPDWYIQDEGVKIQVYKKIAAVRTQKDEDNIYEELVDRFGDVPKETMNLVKAARIRGLSERLSVSRISEQGRFVVTEFAEKNALTAMGILKVNDAFGRTALIHGGVKPIIRIPLRPRQKLDDVIRLLGAVEEGKNMKAC